MLSENQQIFLGFLTRNYYTDVKFFGNTWAGIQPMLYTHAIMFGQVGNCDNADNRWCYDTYEKALDAITKWNGIGDPEGWHRHPMSGRRRPEGDKLQEYINL